MKLRSAIILAICCLCNGYPGDKEKQKGSPHRRERAPDLSEEEYNTLLAILNGNDVCRKQDHKLLCQRIKKHNLKTTVIADPYKGQVVGRLTKNGRILLPRNEIGPCIHFFYQMSFGGGSEKLAKRISQHYFGISKKQVLAFLNSHIHSKSNPTLKNKAPLQPIVSQQIMEIHQVDLVSFEQNVVELDSQRYSYVLSIIDCFSRFLWLRALTDKQSKTVTEKLEQIYLEFGFPKMIQTDRDAEFQGAVKEFATKLNIDMIHSRPYCPQSEGKIESSHSIWKWKLTKHEKLLQSLSTEENWVTMLPYLAHNYNTAVHMSTSKTPYEVMFSIKPNAITQFVKGGKYIEIQSYNSTEDWELQSDEGSVMEESETVEINDADMSIHEREMCSESLKSEVRVTARSADKTMIEENLAKHPPTEYQPGDIVLLKADAVSKRGKLSFSKTTAFFAVIQEHTDFLYTLTLLSGPAGRKVKVKADKITSVTRAAETGTLAQNHFEGNNYKGIEMLLSMMVSQSSPKSGVEMLQRNALLQGLELDSDNDGEGNCLFLAISQQFEKVFGTVRSHRDIRKDVVNFMCSNPTLGSIHLPSFVSNYPSWDAYLDAMGQDGTWGDHLTLIAVANMYHVSIVIVSSVEDSEPIVISPESGQSEGTILLGHIAELHYITLQPVGNNGQSVISINPNATDSVSNNSCSERQSPSISTKSRSLCTCQPPSVLHESSTLELLCDHLLLYIFALATLYSDQTTFNISLVCKRFNALINSQEFRDKQFQEWLKRETDLSTVDIAHREEYQHCRKSAIAYLLCHKCGKEFTSRSGWQQGPDGWQQCYSEDLCRSCVGL